MSGARGTVFEAQEEPILKRAWLRLIRTPHIGGVTFWALLAHFGSAEAAIEALPEFVKHGSRISARSIPAPAAIEKELEKAAIAGMKGEPPLQTWVDVVDTNLIGVLNAVHAALPHLQAGASIVATGSTAAYMNALPMMAVGTDPGGVAYMSAKRLLSAYMHDLARELAPRQIRANVIHPTNVNTDMLQSDPMYKSFRPDLEHPTREDATPAFYVQQAMPVPWIEPVDISNAVLFLASDEARYVTGMQLRVDAGGYLKWYDFHL